MIFAALHRFPAARPGTRVAYLGMVVLAAVNVPVVIVLASPITTALLNAARGALADSITQYLTIENLAAMGAITALGICLPLVTARLKPRKRLFERRSASTRAWLGVALCPLIGLLGTLATRRVDTAGLHRNPLWAIIATSVRRIQPMALDEDWRASPFPRDSAVRSPAVERLRGGSAGSNVLVIVLESTGAQYLGLYGAPKDPTPNLSHLAERALIAEHAYAIYPESVRGLVSYLSSRYPAFDVPNDDHARIAAPSLASILGARGYLTGLFHSGRFMYLGMSELLAGMGFDRLEDAGDIGGNRRSSFGIDEDAAVARILRWIDARPAGKPFFATYLPIAGHHPYTSTTRGPFPDSLDIGRYRNALYDGDRALGTLLRGLEQRRLMDSTVIVVFGDHGEAFGQHPGNYGHTLAIFEENIRVPLVIVPPRGLTKPIRLPTVASLVDVPVTVLDLLGIEAPPSFQGTSILRAKNRMALFFTDYSRGLLGLRDGCTKVIYEMDSKRTRRFDLCADSGEQRDSVLTASNPYEKLLRRWVAAQVSRATRKGEGSSAR